MTSQELKEKIGSLCVSMGAPLWGIAGLSSLTDAPESADPSRLLPSGRSVVSFAIPLDQIALKRYLDKTDWLSHCGDRKQVVRKLYRLGDTLKDFLVSQGYEARNVEVNNNYLPEPGAADITEMTEFLPDFSHRYAAVAAGVGRLGWSGNLMTEEYGSLVELGSVLTSAVIEPDSPIPDEKHPCDKCRMCTLVCPVGMIPSKDSQQVRIAGITEILARKGPNTCCWIGCTGYEGRSHKAQWSNWSPYRLKPPLPEKKTDWDRLCISLQKLDPQMSGEGSSLNDYRSAVFDSDWLYNTVCGFCRGVCFPRKQERTGQKKIIVNSGRAVLKSDGSHGIAGNDSLVVDTPYGVQVEINRKDWQCPDQTELFRDGLFPLDRAVVSYLKKSLSDKLEK